MKLKLAKLHYIKNSKKYILIFNKHEEQKRSHFLPDKNLINVFE